MLITVAVIIIMAVIISEVKSLMGYQWNSQEWKNGRHVIVHRRYERGTYPALPIAYISSV